MQATELTVELREKTGKEGAAKVRQAGGIPAVLYGAGAPPQALSVNSAEIDRLLARADRRLSLLTLKVKANGAETTAAAVMKAIQRHPVNEAITHIDFLRVDLSKKLTLEVPVIIEGASPGVKLGGVLQQMFRHVRVRCLPDLIPEGATADISHMEIGHVLTAGQLKLPEGVELLTAPATSILSIIVIHYEEEKPAEGEAAAEGAATATATDAAAAPSQPEVIGEKEREERRLKKDDEKGARTKEKAELKETKAKEEKKKK